MFSYLLTGKVGIVVIIFWNLSSILANLLAFSGAVVVNSFYWFCTISFKRSVKTFKDIAICEKGSVVNYVLARGSSWVPINLLRGGSI